MNATVLNVTSFHSAITSVCFTGVKDSEDEEEENNSSPVKRPASLMSGKKPPMVATSCSLNLVLAKNIPMNKELMLL